MKKCKTVILLGSLAFASSAHAQVGSSNVPVVPQVQPEGKSQAPATLVPVLPQAVQPGDVGNTFCNDCTLASRSGPWQQVWLKGGYSLWRISDAPLPYPLLTTGPGPLPGVLGDPNTTILYGNQQVDFGAFQGITLEGGMWLDQNHLNGLGFGLQTFSTQTSSAFFSSTGFDGIDLSRPFFDVTQNLQFQNNVLQVSAIGRAGDFAVSNSAKFGGFDAYFMRNLWHDCRFTLSGLVGYRFFQLTEHLNMTQNSQTVDQDTAEPLLLDNNIVNALTIRDSFSAKNQVNGVEIGLKGEWNYGALFAGGTAKVTLGNNRQTVGINGSTSGVIDGVETTLPGGLLALSSNIGTTQANQFVIMPELGGYVGVQLSCHIRLQLGYDLLYINNVVRPGSQIDSNINQRFVPSSQFFGDSSGPVAPNLTQAKNDFFASGVNLSVEIQY